MNITFFALEQFSFQILDIERKLWKFIMKKDKFLFTYLLKLFMPGGK